jgi:hypothetical protein
MRLSEAIRLGAMLRPQGREEFHDKGGRTCAFGAAGDAIGHRFKDSLYEIYPIWPFLETDAMCPKCNARRMVVGVAYNIAKVIVHLNADHKWTREQIAEWVATIEPPEAPPATERSTDAVSAVLDSTSEPVNVYARKGI